MAIVGWVEPEGEWESGRVGEWESGRGGEWESGRGGEWERENLNLKSKI